MNADNYELLALGQDFLILYSEQMGEIREQLRDASEEMSFQEFAQFCREYQVQVFPMGSPKDKSAESKVKRMIFVQRLHRHGIIMQSDRIEEMQANIGAIMGRCMSRRFGLKLR